MPKKPAPPATNVIRLDEARAQRRVSVDRERMERVLASNRRTLDRLHASGQLYSKEGTALGRDLLLAHENLLQADTLLQHLADEGVLPAPRNAVEVQRLYEEVDGLVERTAQLTQKVGHALALLQGP